MTAVALPGRDVPLPVRFGGQASPVHRIMLRFGDREWDGTVWGHLVAQTRRGAVAARCAIKWDPLLDDFVADDTRAIEDLFERLDPASALAGFVVRGVSGTIDTISGVMGELLVPRFFIVGGLGAILFGYLFYYWLWMTAAWFLLLYGLLPALVAVGACAAFYYSRLARLRDAMFQAAWHALQPDRYHAPR